MAEPAASVVITGGASGLGEATARLLGEQPRNWHVVVADLDEEGGRATAAEVNGTFVRADITDEADAIAAVDTAQARAPLRGLVNCAGGGTGGRTIGSEGAYASALALHSFTRVLTLNVVGTFNMIRIAATAMSRNEPDADGGRVAIVNTASVAAFEGQIGQAAYAAAKAAIVGMTLPIARDLSAAGIRVTTIAPGTFETPPMLGVAEEIRASLGAAVPFPKRMGRPAEFAALALHLLTNPYINGETVRIDGGIRMQPK